MTSPARRVGMLLALLIGLASTPSGSFAQQVQYYYDGLGRLLGVVDPQGNGAAYTYDAVGNLLRIRRYTASGSPTDPVQILLVVPTQGTVNTAVQLFGRGFSAVPTENQVAFNGAAATVTAATETSLTALVPPGATTGPLTLTTPLGSATAPDPFSLLGDFVVVPAQADAVLGQTLEFQAWLGGSQTSTVVWRVNGGLGGSAAVGTITPAGLYTAPATPPPVQPVLVEAVRTDAPSWVAPATVHLDAPGGAVAARPLSIGAPNTGGAIAAAAGVSILPPLAPNAQASAPPVAISAAPGGLVPAALVSIGPGVPLVGGALAVTRGPAIAGVAPATAPAPSTNLPLTLTGGNFQNATAVRFLRNGGADSTVTATNVVPVADGTTATCTVTVSGSAPLGARVVQIVSPQGTSTPFAVGPNSFTVTAP